MLLWSCIASSAQQDPVHTSVVRLRPTCNPQHFSPQSTAHCASSSRRSTDQDVWSHTAPRPVLHNPWCWSGSGLWLGEQWQWSRDVDYCGRRQLPQRLCMVWASEIVSWLLLTIFLFKCCSCGCKHFIGRALEWFALLMACSDCFPSLNIEIRGFLWQVMIAFITIQHSFFRSFWP